MICLATINLPTPNLRRLLFSLFLSEDQGCLPRKAAMNPFSPGARIVVGYTSNFHQPWVWVEGDPDIYPRQLLPTGEMWSMFGHWSLMWDSRHYDLGQCISRKDSSVFVLLDDVTVSECNREVEDLSRAIHNFWGSAVSVFWERIEEISRSSVVRIQVSSFRG